MRRCLLVLILCLLPFQLSWAVASAYCQHERDTQPVHWGHHESEESRGNDRSHSGEGAQKNSSTQPNAVIDEGALCHAGSAQHADAAVPAPAVVRRTAQPVAPLPAQRFVSHIAEVPVPPARRLAA